MSETRLLFSVALHEHQLVDDYASFQAMESCEAQMLRSLEPSILPPSPVLSVCRELGENHRELLINDIPLFLYMCF